MSRAGQGGEVGSVFRCAAATYLAVHGLRSHAIPGLDLPEGVHPAQLDFETTDPTDDIRVTFTDGRRGFISAKRKLSRGRPLQETVDGWVRQVPHLGPHDLLLVAAEEFSGPMRKLDSVLRRHRAGLAMDTRAEKEALHAVTSLISDPLVAATVLARARVLYVPHSTSGGHTHSHLAALMDLIVDGAKGVAAVGALGSLFHQQAGQALGSGTEQWVRALEREGIRVVRDPNGPAGARAAAGLAAADAYRQVIAEHRGRIDLTLLATDLPPITVDQLLDAVFVRGDGDRTGTKLLWKLRRWRRLLLVGQPGTGKSVALRDIAAHCAVHPHAPLPLRVHLPALLRENPTRISVDLLIEMATRDIVPTGQQQSLVEHTRSEVEAGRAIFLLDSLDECGKRAAWVSQQLLEVVQALHSRVGFVLSTRASGQDAAARLGLPSLELEPPSDLDATVDQVLVACSQTRVPEQDRSEWLAARREWMRVAKQHHGQLLAVPLLALLVALICAETPETALPRGRAALLHEAIKQAVERWERDRGASTASLWAPALTSAMLLDGFIVLGRLLEGGGRPSNRDARAALIAVLTDPAQWAIAPAAAKEVASDITRFWDEHVAVFVFDGAGNLTSRSKVFVEIATAMWTLQAGQDDLAHWLSDAVDFVDSDGAIALAADLNPNVVPALLGVGRQQPQAATLLATLAVTGVITLTAEQVATCLGQLTTVVRNAHERGDKVGRTSQAPRKNSLRDWLSHTGPRTIWDVVELACRIPVVGGNISRRTALVDRAALAPTAATIAAALAATTDATTQQRRLTDVELSVVWTVLQLPLPDDSHAVKHTRRGFSVMTGSHLMPGVGAVAAAAVHHLDQLPPTAPELIFQITMKGPMGVSGAVFAALDAKGFNTSKRNQWFTTSGLKEWLTSYRLQKREVLSIMASFATDNSAPVQDRDEANWSLTEVGDLLAGTRWGSLDANDLRHEFNADSAQLRHDFIDAVADAFGIDMQAAAEQAKYLLEHAASSDEDGHDDDEDGWFVVATDPIHSPRLVEHVGQALTAQQHITLLACLEARSAWLADTATFILANAQNPPWDSTQLFRKALPDLPRHRVTSVRLVAIFTAGDQRSHLLAQASTSDDPDYRVAARRAVLLAPELDPDGGILHALCRDPDLSVRPKQAHATEPAATCWSCDVCRTINPIDGEDCPGCEHGVRPTQDTQTSDDDE